MNNVEKAFFEAFLTILPIVTNPDTGKTYRPFMTALPIYQFDDKLMKIEIIYKEMEEE